MKFIWWIIIASLVFLPFVIYIDSIIFGGDPKKYLTATILEAFCFFAGIFVCWALMRMEYLKK